MSALSLELARASTFDIDSLLQSDSLLQESQNEHQSAKLEKVLSDLHVYLKQTSSDLAKASKQNNQLHWYLSNKEALHRIGSIVEKVDKFIASAFESQHEIKPKLQSLTVASVDVMQSLMAMKTRCDIAMNYSEVKFQVLDTLRSEVSSCFRIVNAIDTSSPWSVPSGTELEEVLNWYTKQGTGTGKMKSGNDDFSSIMDLEYRIEPMHFSMTILQHRMEEFQVSAKPWFPGAATTIAAEYDMLLADWEDLKRSYRTLKELTIDKQSHSMLQFILSQTSNMVHELARTVREIEPKSRTSQMKGADFKLCSRAISVAEYAFSDKKTTYKDLLRQFNDEVIPRWNYLNGLLSDSIPLEQGSAPDRTPSGGLRPLKIGRLTTPQADVAKDSPRPRSTNATPFGLDLRLPVEESPAVPLSISKLDRIVDLSIEYDIKPKSNLQQALKNEIAQTQQEPIQVPEQDFLRSLNQKPEMSTKKVIPSMSNKELLQKLSKEASEPSRIPSIASNYAELKLPVLKKMFVTGYTPTRIPGISFENSVFRSPERKPPQTPVRPSHSDLSSVMEDSPETVDHLQSPATFKDSPSLNFFSPFDEKRQMPLGGIVLGDLTNTMSRNNRTSKMSLNDISTPNLTFTPATEMTTSPMSWRSTSPERPGSSMGSRFDDQHLTRTLKASKRPWK